MHVGSDGAGPKSVPLLLDQTFPYKVEDLGDLQCKRGSVGPAWAALAPEALAIEPHQIVSFLLLREKNLKKLEKDVTFFRHWAFCPSLASTKAWRSAFVTSGTINWAPKVLRPRRTSSARTASKYHRGRVCMTSLSSW